MNICKLNVNRICDLFVSLDDATIFLSIFSQKNGYELRFIEAPTNDPSIHHIIIRDRHKMGIETLFTHFAINWLSVQLTQLFSSTVMLKLKYE